MMAATAYMGAFGGVLDALIAKLFFQIGKSGTP